MKPITLTIKEGVAHASVSHCALAQGLPRLTVGRRLPAVSSGVNRILRRRSDRPVPPAARAGFWRLVPGCRQREDPGAGSDARAKGMGDQVVSSYALWCLFRLSTSRRCGRGRSDQRRRPLKTSIRRCAGLIGDLRHRYPQIFSQHRRSQRCRHDLGRRSTLDNRRSWQLPPRDWLNVLTPPSPCLVQMIALVMQTKVIS